MRAAAAVLVLGILAPALNTFIAATVMPSAVADIGGLPLYAWATIAYSIASIVGAAASATIARHHGLRRAFVVAGAIFITGSLTCGAAPSMPVLVGGRAIQGFGGGMIVGIVHAMVREVFPRPMWARMLATISLAWGIAALTGPSVGGVLAQLGLWRAAFWATAPFVAITLVMAWRLLPPRPHARADSGGVPLARLLLLCGGVVALGSVANARGLPLRVALAAAMVLAVAGALRLDGRARTRLFPSGMLSLRRPIGRCFWMIFLLAMSTSPTGIYTSLFVQIVHGVSPAVAGYVFATHSLAWTCAALVTARISAGRVRQALVMGPLLLAAGLTSLFFTMGSGPVALITLGLAVDGIGIGTCWAHVGHVVLASAREREEEATATLIPSTQLFAIAFGGAVCGIIADAVGLSHDASPAVALAAAQALFGSFAVLAFAAAAIAARITPAPR
jgi:MFS family permease